MNGHTVINTIRHGETAYNAERRYAGTIDVPLNERGKRDTIKASRSLRGMKFDIIVTSTMKRSLQTAHCLFGRGVKTVQSELCGERNYGRMQGLTAEEVKYIQPRIEYVHAGDDYHSLNPPDGETFEELRRRAQRFFDGIQAEYGGLSILVISHGTFLQQFHGLMRGKDWKQSLETGVRNLEWYAFHFHDGHLLSEQCTPLTELEQNNW